MQPLNRALFALALALSSAAAARAQSPVEPPRLELHAYTLQYRRAEEAVPLVEPLLSAAGALGVQDDGRTLVVRDERRALDRITALLRAFDRQVLPLDLEILIVQARRGVSPPGTPNRMPRELGRKLARTLPYRSYVLRARTELGTREGEEVTYQVGDDYSVRFQVGRLEAGAQLQLRDFQLFHGPAEQPLIHSTLHVRLEETYALGLAKSKDSPTALMVVLIAHYRPDAR